MDTQVRITLRTSRTYFVMLGGFALALILNISALPVPPVLCWIGYLAVLASTAWVLRREVLLQSGQSCLSFVCDKNQGISLWLNNGDQISGEVSADTIVSPWLVLLNVVTTGRARRSLLLFPDAMAAEDYRRLCVLLRNSVHFQS